MSNDTSRRCDWKQFTGIEVDLVSGGELLDRKGVRSSGTVHFAVRMHEQINSFVATNAPDKQMVFCADRIAVETIEGNPSPSTPTSIPSFGCQTRTRSAALE
jgi:hypothetical protein